MDISSVSLTTSALNLAARRNDVKAVERLLKKFNPNFSDSQGWTCLHEAAVADSYESIQIILKHKHIRPLIKTHDGHTALLLACRYHRSIQTIEALLESDPAIVNYESTEHVTPLHISSTQGRVDVIQLLLDYGAQIDVKDFDGDTALHNATFSKQHEAVAVLLHAGADPEIENRSNYIPFHLACQKGCYESVKHLYPFNIDINKVTINGDTPLILATQGWNDKTVKFLLHMGADPHLRNKNGDLALTMAFYTGNSTSFGTLLLVTDINLLCYNMVFYICKPQFYNFNILQILLTCDILGHDYFDFCDQVVPSDMGKCSPIYHTNPPINSYLNICEYVYQKSRDKFQQFFYIFLMHGLMVNVLDANECPPLVHIHYCRHTACFKDVFQILREHGCNVDYSSSLADIKEKKVIPDAFLASLITDPTTSPVMLPYSLHYDPEYMLLFARKNGMLGRIPQQVKDQLLLMIDENFEGITAGELPFTVLTLKHLSRQKIRSVIRNTKSHYFSTNQFLDTLDRIELPRSLKDYLRFL